MALYDTVPPFWDPGITIDPRDPWPQSEKVQQTNLNHRKLYIPQTLPKKVLGSIRMLEECRDPHQFRSIPFDGLQHRLAPVIFGGFHCGEKWLGNEHVPN